jgi:hypothetical protein
MNHRNPAVVVVASILLSASLHAEPRWGSLAAPLRAGQVELQGGLGGGVDAGPVGVLPEPALAIGARWGITDSLQIAFPLLVTISTDVEGGWPRLSMSGGVAGVGYSSVEGVIVEPYIEAAAHFVGDRQLVVLRVDARGRIDGAAGEVSTLSTWGGLGYRLDDAWSIGMGAGLAARAVRFGEYQESATGLTSS